MEWNDLVCVRGADLLGGGRTSQHEFIKSSSKTVCTTMVVSWLAFEVD